jgi:hypothetical protein
MQHLPSLHLASCRLKICTARILDFDNDIICNAHILSNSPCKCIIGTILNGQQTLRCIMKLGLSYRSQEFGLKQVEKTLAHISTLQPWITGIQLALRQSH